MNENSAEAGSQKKGLPATLQQMLRAMAGDMKLLGIVQVVLGAVYCLSIFGAVIGVPILIAGLRLKESGDMFVVYAGTAETARLKGALEMQAKFFKIMKILFFVSVGLGVLTLAFMILFSAYIASQFVPSYE